MLHPPPILPASRWTQAARPGRAHRRIGDSPRCRRARLPAPRATRRQGRRGHAAPERM